MAQFGKTFINMTLFGVIYLDIKMCSVKRNHVNKYDGITPGFTFFNNIPNIVQYIQCVHLYISLPHGNRFTYLTIIFQLRGISTMLFVKCCRGFCCCQTPIISLP